MGQALLAYERISRRDGKAICIKTHTPLPGLQFIDTNSTAYTSMSESHIILRYLTLVRRKESKQKNGQLEKNIIIRAYLCISLN